MIDDRLFCCLTEEQQAKLINDLANRDYASTYQFQEHLIKEKTGYRCSICGKFYPFLRIQYQDKMQAPENFSKIKGELKKYKKAASVFCGDHYYALNKKTLQKFVLNDAQNMQQTDTIPIMGEVYHVIVSDTETYAALETFGGTIGIVDLKTKEIIAKKKKHKINGSYIFHKAENRLLYFWEDAIWSWDFLNKSEEKLWEVPKGWLFSEEDGKRYYVSCGSPFYNSLQNTYLFQCNVGKNTYVVLLKENEQPQMVELPQAGSLCELVYLEAQNQYTLYAEDKANTLDENFQIVESFSCPNFLQYSDGGGCFPITFYDSDWPQRIFISPDGKWILLDYFTHLILMKHEGYEIKYCLFSYTGRTANHMGFVDNNHFWYTWGDTTYIQEIKED